MKHAKYLGNPESEVAGLKCIVDHSIYLFNSLIYLDLEPAFPLLPDPKVDYKT